MTDGHASGTDKESDMETDSSAGMDGDGSNDHNGFPESVDPECGLQGSPAAAMGCMSPTSPNLHTTKHLIAQFTKLSET